MKYIVLILIFSIGHLVFAQDNCKYSIVINSENLKETGKFQLFFKNNGDENLKIPKKLNLCNMRLENLELFNERSQQFEKMKLANKDIDCFEYQKQKKLNSNKLFIYEIDFKNELQVIEYDGFFEKYNSKKYRFKISFYFQGNHDCKKYNNIITDWIYKN